MTDVDTRYNATTVSRIQGRLNDTQKFIAENIGSATGADLEKTEILLLAARDYVHKMIARGAAKVTFEEKSKEIYVMLLENEKFKFEKHCFSASNNFGESSNIILMK